MCRCAANLSGSSATASEPFGAASVTAWSQVVTPLPALGLELVEPRRGYRFAPESPAIADFCVPGARVLDLGAGCGVIGLCLAASAPERIHRLVLVENNEELAASCEANVSKFSCASLVRADLRDLELGEVFDTVVTNPPYFDVGSGVESSRESTRGATHRLAGGPREFASVAARHLAPDGSLWMVHPADRISDLLDAASFAGLHLARTVLLDARHTQRPYRVWMQFRREPSPAEVVRASVLTAR